MAGVWGACRGGRGGGGAAWRAGREGARAPPPRLWHPSVCRSCLAGELAVGNVELGKHVARRQGHVGQGGRVPGGQHDAPVGRVVLQQAHHLSQLVHALPAVVGVAVGVGRPKVAPLEAVDGAQVALLPVPQPGSVQERARPVAVPDADALGGQGPGVGGAGHEPQQLLHHPPPEHALGRQQGEGAAQVETQRPPKHGQRAGAGAVAALHALVHDLFDQVQVLGRRAGWRVGGGGGLGGGRVGARRPTTRRTPRPPTASLATPPTAPGPSGARPKIRRLHPPASRRAAARRRAGRRGAAPGRARTSQTHTAPRPPAAPGRPTTGARPRGPEPA